MRKVFKRLTFIDLFAGIGGFRIGCEKNYMKCVWSCEIDKYSAEVYARNFGEVPFGDITKVKAGDVPDHDLLCGGFPCQAFSMAGKRQGFEDTRGTLFYEILRIIKEKKPKVFLLENVVGLISHDNGRTLNTILDCLARSTNGTNLFFKFEDSLNYDVWWTVLNSADFGLAQNRKRIFIVGFRNDLDIRTFKFPDGSKVDDRILSDIIENDVPDEFYFSKNRIQKIQKGISIRKCEKQKLLLLNQSLFDFDFDQDFIAKCLKIKGLENRSSTLSTLVSGKTCGYLNTGVFFDGIGIRIFTPRECARLQGFPEEFKHCEKESYKQIGNAVSPPVIEAIVYEIKKKLLE